MVYTYSRPIPRHQLQNHQLTPTERALEWIAYKHAAQRAGEPPGIASFLDPGLVRDGFQRRFVVLTGPYANEACALQDRLSLYERVPVEDLPQAVQTRFSERLTSPTFKFWLLRRGVLPNQAALRPGTPGHLVAKSRFLSQEFKIALRHLADDSPDRVILTSPEESRHYIAQETRALRFNLLDWGRIFLGIRPPQRLARD